MIPLGTVFTIMLHHVTVTTVQQNLNVDVVGKDLSTSAFILMLYYTIQEFTRKELSAGEKIFPKKSTPHDVMWAVFSQ